ncbi:MAG: hypothetical protein ACKOXH_07745, partial [Aquirufa sp.]
MKRIATLFLIVTLFYNMIGYYLMFAYKEQQAWVARMEKTSHTDFRVMRLNASLYSFADDTEFEEVNEDVIINNKSYHIFKKQVKDNVLSLYYLPNSNENTVSKDLNDIVDSQLFNSGNSKESPVKKLLKSFIKDYIDNPEISIPLQTEKLASTSLITPNV